MGNIIELFMILVVSYLLFSFLFDTKEHYVTSIVGYNNINIPAYHLPSIFDLETKELVKIFKESFKDDNLEPLGFTEHNPYIPFPFEESIKKLIIDYIKTNIEKFKGHKLENTTGLHKLYYKDNGTDRLFIFNISLVDNTKFMTRNLRVKIKIKNIKNFIKKNSNIIEQKEIDYKTNIPSQTFINSTEILSIRMDKNNYAQFELEGIDKLRPNYYQIKNVLGLMDPFVTSGKDMIITDKMKTDFVKEIQEHQKLLDGKTK
jgi:hypothetical protein